MLYIPGRWYHEWEMLVPTQSQCQNYGIKHLDDRQKDKLELFVYPAWIRMTISLFTSH